MLPGPAGATGATGYTGPTGAGLLALPGIQDLPEPQASPAILDLQA